RVGAEARLGPRPPAAPGLTHDVLTLERAHGTGDLVRAHRERRHVRRRGLGARRRSVVDAVADRHLLANAVAVTQPLPAAVGEGGHGRERRGDRCKAHLHSALLHGACRCGKFCAAWRVRRNAFALAECYGLSSRGGAREPRRRLDRRLLLLLFFLFLFLFLFLLLALLLDDQRAIRLLLLLL